MIRPFLIALGLLLLQLTDVVAFQAYRIPINWEKLHDQKTIRHFTVESGLPVNSIVSILPGNDDYLYIATFDGLVRFDGDRFVIFNTANTPGLKRNRLARILTGTNNSIWIQDTSGNIYSFKDGKATLLSDLISELNLTVLNFQTDSTLQLLIYTTTGLWKQKKEGFEFEQINSVEYSNPVTEVKNENAKTPEFEALFENGLSFEGKEILSLSDSVWTISKDYEGGIWIRTVGDGIFQVLPKKMLTIGENYVQGLSNVYGLYEDTNQNIWAGGFTNGIFRVNNSNIEHWNEKNGTLPATTIRTLIELKNGKTYAGGGDGIWKLENDKWIFENPLIGVDAFFEDTQNRFWVGSNTGLYLLKEDKLIPFLDVNGTTIEQTKSIVELQNEELLFATAGQGIAFLNTENLFQFITSEDDLSSDLVRDIYVTSSDTLWVATEDLGLDRVILGEGFVPRQINNVSTADGLISNSLHRLIEDEFGFFWINSNNGIMRINKVELNAYMDGFTSSFSVESFTTKNDLLDNEGNGGAQSSGLLTKDGKLLFPNQTGLVYTRPEWHLTPDNLTLVKPRAETFSFSDSVISLENIPAFSLPKTIRNFQIKFTLPTFTTPKNLILEYKMEGVNDTWTRVGAERLASFTNVPGGSYTFLMRGKLTGQTDYAEGRLNLTVPKLFYETSWFALFVITIGLLLFWLLFRFLLRRGKNREAHLNELVKVRTTELVKEKEKTETALEQLRKLDESKSRFFTNFTHELRTPLSLILNPLEEMIEGDSSTQPQKRDTNLSLMKRNAERLKRQVNQLLDVSKLNTGEFTLSVEPVDLETLTKQYASQFEHALARKAITLTVSSLKTLSPIYLDVSSWEHICTNLLSNALKFTPENGEISISFSEKKNTVIITFTDSGIGIPDSELPFVFDSYFQGESSISKAEGTGIGLSLVKGLIERFGGSIHVLSEIEKGTTFSITLKKGFLHFGSKDSIRHELRSYETHAPKNITDEEKFVDIAVSDENSSLQSILLVDDNEDFRGYLHSLIAPFYNVKVATNGKEGIACLEDFRPDIILSDIMMPEMDGYEMMRAIRAMQPYKHIPFIFLSAKDSDVDIETGLNSGADIYLTKPVQNKLLLTQIRVLLRREQSLSKSKIALNIDPISPLLKNVHEIIQRHLGSPDLSIDMIAMALSMSRSSLFRKWKKESKETINQKITALRLDEAIRLIKEEDITISEAAYAVGFNHTSYFSKAFKKIYGVTPQEYLAEE